MCCDIRDKQDIEETQQRDTSNDETACYRNPLWTKMFLKLGLSLGGYIKNYLEIQLKSHWWIKSVLKLFTIKMFPTFRSQSRTFFRGSERKIMQKHSYKQDAD